MSIGKLQTALTGEGPHLGAMFRDEPAVSRWLGGIHGRARRGGLAAAIEVVLAGPSAGPIKALLGTPHGRAALAGIARRHAAGAHTIGQDAFAAGLEKISALRTAPQEAARRVAALLKVLADEPAREEPPDRATRAGQRERPRRRAPWIDFESPKELRARLDAIDQLMERQPHGYIYAAHRFADPSRPPEAVKRAHERAAAESLIRLRREREQRAAADDAVDRPADAPLRG